MGLDNNTSIHLEEESVKDAGKTKYTVCALALEKCKEEYSNAEIQFLFNVTFHFNFCSLILKVDFKYIYPLEIFLPLPQMLIAILYFKFSYSKKERKKQRKNMQLEPTIH